MIEISPRFFRHSPSLLARTAFFVMLSLLLMALDSRSKYLGGVREIFSVIVYPLQKLAHVPMSMYDATSELFQHGEIAEENARLKQQHLVDKGQLLRLRALEAENTQLRKLLNTTQRIENKATVAEILRVPHDPFNRKVLLDKGSMAGIESGQVVVDDMGVVGQVTRNYPLASEVTLLTDRDHSVPVQVVRNGLRSIISGTGREGVLELRYMAINTDIQEGDVLVTSGIDGIYPPGLPVAAVSQIERNPNYIFARIICTPASGVNQNRQLLILSMRAPRTGTPAEATKMKPRPQEARRQ
ncbi:MAG: rod shape-determining protein MreC [Nitrosomonadales bacterium SCN 54-20]|nr:MAG: rod shape-determining protein MreC [Nitrosomonadales bacterium SCN 54-20]